MYVDFFRIFLFLKRKIGLGTITTITIYYNGQNIHYQLRAFLSRVFLNNKILSLLLTWQIYYQKKKHTKSKKKVTLVTVGKLSTKIHRKVYIRIYIENNNWP